ncbi:hypothetical protein [Sphingomonas psychrotolerans]|uniref:Spermidine synthase n=1 Tax=Sphingomonas psychrotolerans TaxID=1327635 RepID=A0A2K8MGC7_9SPHN|nr:hypothetical protein [Sphingomonas psychrotolerans]ATY32942.1 hypothetical protein CVN68_14030 [Sphingomonas psychrotolerans]
MIDSRALLGDFRTGLWLPRFREGQCGAWSVRLLPVTAARGYWGQGYRTLGAVMLIGPFAESGAAWMSLVPMEIESQEIGIAAARGHTVVLGLGMGWCAANIALNPAVERVTVVERDPDVVALIAALGVFDQLPAEARAKLRIVEGDALTWRAGERVDCVHADIWATFLASERWNEVRRIHANIGADMFYFWGQELELWRLTPRTPELTTLVAETGLPLIVDPRPGYAERIAEAALWWTPATHG